MEIDLQSTNIAAHFVTCAACDRIWRTVNATRCPHCAQAYGLPYQLNPLAQSDLMDAMRDFGNLEEYKEENDFMRLALSMEDNCPWFDVEDPWITQSCWMHLREYLRDQPPIVHIERAMEIFETQFEDHMMSVHQNMGLPPPVSWYTRAPLAPSPMG